MRHDLVFGIRKFIAVPIVLFLLTNPMNNIQGNDITLRNISTNKLDVIQSQELNRVRYLSLTDLEKLLDLHWEWDFIHGVSELAFKDYQIRMTINLKGYLLNDQFFEMEDAIVQTTEDVWIPMAVFLERFVPLWDGELTWNDRLNELQLVTSDQSLKPSLKTKPEQYLIVIDPGHGGSDFGCEMGFKMLEKDYTMQLAEKTVRILEDRMGAEVRLTRSGDYFLDVDSRLALANSAKADLFVSIHFAPATDLMGNDFNIYIGNQNPRSEPESRIERWDETSEQIQMRSAIQAKAAGAALAAASRDARWSLKRKRMKLRILKGSVCPGFLLEISDTAAFYGDLSLNQTGGLRRAAEAVFDCIKAALEASYSDESNP